MINRGRRRRSDRRNRRGQRRGGRVTVLSWVFIIAGLLLLFSLVLGGLWLSKRLEAPERPGGLVERGSQEGAERGGQGGAPGRGDQKSLLDEDSPRTAEENRQGYRQENQSGGDGLPDESPAGKLLRSMTLEDKVAQLFIITPEQLTGVERVYSAGTATKEAFDRRPVGGLIYFSGNIETPAQVKKMLANVKQYSYERTGAPAFLCVDEEGGSSVSRVAGNPAFQVPRFENMARLGEREDPAAAYEVGAAIGGYLSELGFTVNFAPVADVLENENNKLLRDRSFGKDEELVARYVAEEVKGLQQHGVKAVLKHYPGHGAAKEDTHEGYAHTDKTLGELLSTDLVPFQAGVAAGADFIMVSHIAAPAVTGDDTPASMSPVLLTDVLREGMGFEGIIVTDSLSMKAVTQRSTPSEAAVNALLAGADLLLMPADFEEAYEGVLEAVRTGVLSEERIDRSLMRILSVKVSLH